MSIRFHHSRPHSGQTSYYSFTFLASNIATDQQFDAMALRIRQELTGRYPGHRLDMLVEFYPQNGVANVHNTVRFIAGITGTYLFNIYNGILQSQETIQVEGLRIRITVVGQRMGRRRGRGRGRTLGANHLPAKYKGLGLSCHPDEPLAIGPCMTRAILLAMNENLRKKQNLIELDFQSKELASEVGVTGTEMENHHVGEIVKLEKYKTWRIIVINELLNIDYQGTGEDWIQPEDRSIDYNTVYLFLGI